MQDGYWARKNVFITGAAGFLGSWLTKFLVDAGADVTVLLRDVVPGSNLYRNGYVHKVNIVRGQLEDYFVLERALGEYDIDTVFHLGAQTQVGIANRNPLSTFESNIKGTWNVLEAARRSPLVKKVIVASSDKAYGIHKELPYTEEAPLKGSHPYDVSKSAADLIARTYYESYGLPVVITRCGNFYGGGDTNFNRLIPQTIRHILNNESPIIRSDGTFIRDYFYIEDGAHAYIELAEKMDDERIHGHAFNFSNESQMTALQVVERIASLMQTPLKPTILGEASNEIPHQYLSAAKARSMLGWQPRFTFDQGLQNTIAWYKEFLN
ncbi:MAG: sugar dehydratase [Candidatus Ryanbacteria bacterium CG10_big_fil_rev_8_21_14_0_10_43_42]|uniref:Sugar dehydratase n=1 Tax=Candidatus Ryanbacteria bacterium CG10_big_fil_rev_8_21_14_0_10_43_42 TaxID=1974864 RepID=A0A2M8KXJ0_9BACT|nr:MAG: sugar dehydratase [Candidatus Ryanbacteria bacterium CG10_big_fil_rev_8_21_14_0_10_43_42]